MGIADNLVLISVLLIAMVNRQSLLFITPFALGECAFYLTDSGIYFSSITASIYAITVFFANKTKIELQSSLMLYSVLYWFSALDYAVFESVTDFYVIFPYVIKIIDIYVIYHLLNSEGQNIGAIHSAPRGSFYQRLSGL